MPADGPRKKDCWSTAEDIELLKHVKMHGTSCWATIAKAMGSRTSKSCRLRWFNQLDPSLKRCKFSHAEDALILLAHKTHGNKWALISRMLPGRTDNAVKNHWNSSLTRLMELGRLNENPLIKGHVAVNVLQDTIAREHEVWLKTRGKIPDFPDQPVKSKSRVPTKRSGKADPVRTSPRQAKKAKKDPDAAALTVGRPPALLSDCVKGNALERNVAMRDYLPPLSGPTPLRSLSFEDLPSQAASALDESTVGLTAALQLPDPGRNPATRSQTSPTLDKMSSMETEAQPLVTLGSLDASDKDLLVSAAKMFIRVQKQNSCSKIGSGSIPTPLDAPQLECNHEDKLFTEGIDRLMASAEPLVAMNDAFEADKCKEASESQSPFLSQQSSDSTYPKPSMDSGLFDGLSAELLRWDEPPVAISNGFTGNDMAYDFGMNSSVDCFGFGNFLTTSSALPLDFAAVSSF